MLLATLNPSNFGHNCFQPRKKVFVVEPGKCEAPLVHQIWLLCQCYGWVNCVGVRITHNYTGFWAMCIWIVYRMYFQHNIIKLFKIPNLLKAKKSEIKIERDGENTIHWFDTWAARSSNFIDVLLLLLLLMFSPF